MQCPKCGAENDNNAFRCVTCGEVLQKVQQAAPPFQPVPNYLVQAILVTLFCCLPLGIAAIVYAAQVNGKLAAGDQAGAIKASNTAKTLCWVSFGLGLVIGAIYLIVYIGGHSRF